MECPWCFSGTGFSLSIKHRITSGCNQEPGKQMEIAIAIIMGLRIEGLNAK